MNCVLALCHFCELHGPNVVLCTEPIYPGTVAVETKPVECHRVCEACAPMTNEGFFSVDEAFTISFSTHQNPNSCVDKLLHQACVRSLSCEVCPTKEGPIFFGDSVHGHVLTYVFSIKDAYARGFVRWFSIVLLSTDKYSVLNHFKYLTMRMEHIARKLQDKAIKVYETEHLECVQHGSSTHLQDDCTISSTPTTSDTRSQCPHHLYHDMYRQDATLPNIASLCITSHPVNRSEERKIKPIRSLKEITNDEDVLQSIHVEFSTIMRSSFLHFEELLPDGLFVNTTPTEQVSCRDLCAKVLRELQMALDAESFRSVLYCCVMNETVIARGTRPTVNSLLRALEQLHPDGIHPTVCLADSYDSITFTTNCTLIGLPPGMPCPLIQSGVMILDVTDDTPRCVTMQWGGIPPTKSPTMLQQFTKALSCPDTSTATIEQFLVTLKRRWYNIAKMVVELEKTSCTVSLNHILTVLGAHPHDHGLVSYWASRIKSREERHFTK